MTDINERYNREGYISNPPPWRRGNGDIQWDVALVMSFIALTLIAMIATAGAEVYWTLTKAHALQRASDPELIQSLVNALDQEQSP